MFCYPRFQTNGLVWYGYNVHRYVTAASKGTVFFKTMRAALAAGSIDHAGNLAAPSTDQAGNDRRKVRLGTEKAGSASTNFWTGCLILLEGGTCSMTEAVYITEYTADTRTITIGNDDHFPAKDCGDSSTFKITCPPTNVIEFCTNLACGAATGAITISASMVGKRVAHTVTGLKAQTKYVGNQTNPNQAKQPKQPCELGYRFLGSCFLVRRRRPIIT